MSYIFIGLSGIIDDIKRILLCLGGGGTMDILNQTTEQEKMKKATRKSLLLHRRRSFNIGREETTAISVGITLHMHFKDSKI